MNFQTRLFLQLLAITLTLLTIFVYGAIRYTRAAFDEIDAQQAQVQITQFEYQFRRFGDDVVRRVEGIANTEETLRMAIYLANPKADKSLYVHDAIGAAHDRNLDVLEIATWDGTVISSMPDYSRIGRDNTVMWVKMDWSDSPAFLDKRRLPEGDALLLLAVRSNAATSDGPYIIGGCRVDQNILSLVTLPSNMRALLYRNFNESKFEPNQLLDRNGVVGQAQRLAPLIQQVQRRRQPVAQTIQWTDKAASAEAFYALPLSGRNNELLGILLVGSSRRESVPLVRRTEWFAVGFAAGQHSSSPCRVCFWCSLRASRLRGQTT